MFLCQAASRRGLGRGIPWSGPGLQPAQFCQSRLPRRRHSGTESRLLWCPGWLPLASLPTRQCARAHAIGLIGAATRDRECRVFERKCRPVAGFFEEPDTSFANRIS